MIKELQPHEKVEREEAAKAIRALSDYVNRHHNLDVLVEFMQLEHRTLQQCMTGFMLKWLVHLSTLNENYYDLRNEASVKTAKQIVAAVPIVEMAKQIVAAVPDVKYRLPLI